MRVKASENAAVEWAPLAAPGHEAGEQPGKSFLDTLLERAADGTAMTNALVDCLVQPW
jgi:hypothetical protein